MVQAVTLAVIVGLLLAEWRVSLANDAALDRLGAARPDEPQYPVMAAVYPLAFVLMGAEAWWRGEGPGFLFPSGVVLFIGAKTLKYWAIRTLGSRWTFGVRVLDGAPLVTDGPYRYVAHPNYVGVVGELIGTAMMMGAMVTGPLMTGLFCVLMWRRVQFEERALHGK